MKLRNKKTGEIVDDGYVRETHDFQFDGQKHILAVFKGNGHKPPERVSGAYKSLAELNEEWEDYKPAEPLIKDEKIRKAVRAWADNLRAVRCDEKITFYVDEVYCSFFAEACWKDDTRDMAELDLVFDYEGLDDGKTYTIAELCGEED